MERARRFYVEPKCFTAPGVWPYGVRDMLPVMVLDTHAAVKRLIDAGADEALAVAVVEVAREASTEATGEQVTPAHFDTALGQLESRLVWCLVPAGNAIAAVVVAALRFPRLDTRVDDWQRSNARLTVPRYDTEGVTLTPSHRTRL